MLQRSQKLERTTPNDKVAWCPDKPEVADEPIEEELAAAAEKIQTLLGPREDLFLDPHYLGALPEHWLQAKLTISLKHMGG